MAACIYHDLIPNVLYFCLCLFPILVRQLFEIITACQLTKNTFTCDSQDTDFFCPNWSGIKYDEGIYSHNDVRQPCLYFKGIEDVF